MKEELKNMATQKLSEDAKLSYNTIVGNQRKEETNLDDLPTQIKIEDIKPENTATIIAESNNALNRKYEEDDIIPTYNIHSRIPCNQIHQFFTAGNTILNEDDDRKISKYISDFDKKTIRDNDSSEKKIQRISSDSSDVDVRPKKRVVLKFSEGDLPSSDEIEQFVKANPKREIDNASTETESNEQDDAIPLFKERKNRKKSAKFDSVEKFEALPTRIITRVRKPTPYSSDIILKPRYLMEQEKDIDKEIITENISRLRTFLSPNEDPRDCLKNRKNINKQEESKKHVYLLRNTSKSSINDDLNRKPTPEINEDITRKKFTNIDCSVKSKNITKSTKAKKKVDNGTKKRIYKSAKYVKVERETRSRIAHALQVETQEHEQSQANLHSIVESNHESRKTRGTYKEQENNGFASTKWEVHEKVKNQQKSPEPVREPRRSRRIRATNDVKENEPTPAKVKQVHQLNQRAVHNNSNAMNQSSKRLKKLPKFDVLVHTKRLRSRIIRSGGLRPLNRRT